MDNPINYFEKLCREYVRERVNDEDMALDAMAIALNHLPPRYYRDENCLARKSMQGYLEDYQFMAEEACERAILYVQSHERKPCLPEDEQG